MSGPTKPGRLLVAQVDHASGEVLGFALGKIMEIGARNVHLIPTVTKKNRPGHIIVIDTDESCEPAIGRFLAGELKVTGYHRIETSHIFERVSFVTKTVTIEALGRSLSLECDAKLIGDDQQPLASDIEHERIVQVQKEIRERLGVQVSLDTLRTMIEVRLREPGNIRITL